MYLVEFLGINLGKSFSILCKSGLSTAFSPYSAFIDSYIAAYIKYTCNVF